MPNHSDNACIILNIIHKVTNGLAADKSFSFHDSFSFSARNSRLSALAASETFFLYAKHDLCMRWEKY